MVPYHKMESSTNISSLPKEIHLMIISYIDFFDIFDVYYTNKYFFEIVGKKYSIRPLSEKILPTFEIFKK